MKKYLFIIVFLSVFLLSSCEKQEAAIFLSDSPIEVKNISYLPDNPTFRVRQRIYFLLASKKPIECPVLRLQTIKLENKYGDPIPQMEIPYATDIERGENQHIVSDYFVLHQSGDYFVRIFALNRLSKPIAQTEFVIEK